MSELLIRGLTKSFGAHMALTDVNLEVDAGQLLVVLGPSGCGKSTLLRLIAGLETADRGEIILEGNNITGLEPQKRKTALVFQNYALYPHMTVFENMAFPLKVAHLPKKAVSEAVHKTARLLELEALLERRPGQLSGGQRQRVALGRGLVRQPSIFLLDEPLSNLDAALRIKMRQEIVSLQKRLGITMIYVTHDQTEALTMADRLAVIKDGRICQTGTPIEIYDNPGNSFVASFVGTPPINLFDEEISGGRGKLLPVNYGIPEGRYKVGVRPEHIVLGAGGALSGKVVSAEYVGSVSHLRVQAGQLTLALTKRRGDTSLSEPGQQVNFDVKTKDFLFFDSESGRRIEM